MPADIASQIVIMSSPAVAGHVTGQVVMVEGGMEGDLLWIIPNQTLNIIS